MKELATALAAAQAEMPAAKFDSTNPHFKSRFASLASVREAAKCASKHGLSFVQNVEHENGQLRCVTTIMHASGDSIISASPWFNPTKQDAHGIAAATTYARRIGLATAFGISSDEDDDGNVASGKTDGKPDPQEISRTMVMKVSNAILDAASNDKEISLLENWEAATSFGQDFASLVWHNLPTPVRDKVRAVQNAKEKRNGNAAKS